MAAILIIVGLVIMLVGLGFFLVPPKEQPTAQGFVGETAEVIKQVSALLDKLDKRYRPGLILMLIGLAVVGCGVYLESVDAKNAAKKVGVSAAIMSGQPTAGPLVSRKGL